MFFIKKKNTLLSKNYEEHDMMFSFNKTKLYKNVHRCLIIHSITFYSCLIQFSVVKSWNLSEW